MALYGYTNKVLAEIHAHLLKHPELTKFLYYTDIEYQNKDILEQEKPSARDIANKKIFIYKNFENLVLKQRKQNFCVCIIIICKKGV